MWYMGVESSVMADRPNVNSQSGIDAELLMFADSVDQAQHTADAQEPAYRAQWGQQGAPVNRGDTAIGANGSWGRRVETEPLTPAVNRVDSVPSANGSWGRRVEVEPLTPRPLQVEPLTPRPLENNFKTPDWGVEPLRQAEQPAPLERTTVTEALPRPEGGVLTVRYGEADFDKKIWQGGYDTLRITGFPQGVGVSSWMDNGGVYFWYLGGTDGNAHHHMPPNLKTLEVNGVRQDVDEMRLQSSQAVLAEADPYHKGFSSINGSTDAMQFGMRMSSIADGTLQMQEKMLRQMAEGSPNNPYFRIYLADAILAQAFKPVINQVLSGQNTISVNDAYTLRRIDEAIIENQKAQQISNQFGRVMFPNTNMQPGLNPFALNPIYYNPDMYWGGALYQSYQREVGLKFLKAFAANAGKFELPPIEPGR